jgi:hypothetical protein
MTKSKTVPAAGKAARPAGAAQPAAPANAEQAIQQAQHGKVNVTPERAIEMAGTL